MYKKGDAVIVTTALRGIFFGYFVEESSDGTTVTLERPRNVLKWSAEVKGFLGLASVGPTKNCRVTGEAPEAVKLLQVTSVIVVSKKAIKAFEAAPWG